MSNINVGDYVVFNGYPYEHFYRHEKEFIEKNMSIGSEYKIINIDKLTEDTYWYRIQVNEHIGTYWIPSVCFELENFKNKYGLK